MKGWEKRIDDVQKALNHAKLDGWLLYDFRKSNRLALNFLEIGPEVLLTRRFCYWIPVQGVPTKIVHRIESNVLESLPGVTQAYSTWRELEHVLEKTLSGSRAIAMEYSPHNAIPTVSCVDAGMVELVRGLGVSVVSSADLLQQYTSIWTQEQYQMHQQAALVLQESIEKAWQLIAARVKAKKKVTEGEVAEFLLSEMKKRRCVADHPPICAVNGHSADPHYHSAQSGQTIKKGDFVLIDASCKLNKPKAVYADITRVAVVGTKATKMQKEIFAIVQAARDAALQLIRKRLKAGRKTRGYEVDEACRQVIVKKGYGEFFPHRTGHNIGESVHGEGANIDSFETHDIRLLLPGTCFSIEPGIYLPGEFGIRLEDDVFLKPDGASFAITPGMQTEIAMLL